MSEEEVTVEIGDQLASKDEIFHRLHSSQLLEWAREAWFVSVKYLTAEQIDAVASQEAWSFYLMHHAILLREESRTESEKKEIIRKMEIAMFMLEAHKSTNKGYQFRFRHYHEAMKIIHDRINRLRDEE